jgi:Major Facilitator Superfamily
VDQPRVTYRDLLSTRGAVPLFTLNLVSGLAGPIWYLTLVFLALRLFRSPALAGLLGFASLAPALPVGLVTGALLDRYGRRRLIAADRLITTGVVTVMAITLAIGVLTPPLLVGLTAVAAVTRPMFQIGMRASKQLIFARGQWDRANAVDNAAVSLAAVAGAGLSGVLFDGVGVAAPVIAAAILAAVGALCALRLPAMVDDQIGGATNQGIFAATIEGIRFGLQIRTIRGLMLMLPMLNASMSMGSLVLTATLLHASGSTAVVGIVYGVAAFAEVIVNLIVGRLSTLGREYLILAVGLVIQAGVYIVAAAATTGPVSAFVIIITAMLSAPLLIAYSSALQRSADPTIYARASGSLSVIGVMGAPLGSAAAGAVLSISLPLALLATAGLSLVAALPTVLVRPSRSNDVAGIEQSDGREN